jgi:hypothetical protein
MIQELPSISQAKAYVEPLKNKKKAELIKAKCQEVL